MSTDVPKPTAISLQARLKLYKLVYRLFLIHIMIGWNPQIMTKVAKTCVIPGQARHRQFYRYMMDVVK
jgi:hypothetical protein